MSASSSSPITIGIAGLTGKFGTLIAQNLIQSPSVSLRGFVRNPAKLSPSIASSPNLTIFTGEASDRAAITPFVTGCDVVLCTYLGDDSLMLDGQKLLIDECEAAGVPRYIASDWSLDYDKLEYGQLFAKDPMKRVRGYLETKEKVKGVHISVGGFMETVVSPFFGIVEVEGPGDGKEVRVRYWGDGDEVWEGTTSADAAEYTAKVAMDRSAVGAKRFIGETTTMKSLAKSLENVYGVKATLERLGSLEELYTTMHKIRNETPTEVFKYTPMFFKYYITNGQTLVGPDELDESYPELKPVGWEEFMRSFPNVRALTGAYFGL